jgi:hypothetical protein
VFFDDSMFLHTIPRKPSERVLIESNSCSFCTKSYGKTEVLTRSFNKIVDRPSLSTFKPSQGESKSLLADLWLSTVDVPLNPNNEDRRVGGGWTGNKFPSFLLHELKDPENKDLLAFKSIDSASMKGPYYLYGTSGAGKTRSIFEYLSHNKGVYFLCYDFDRNPGSKDLYRVLGNFDEFEGIRLPEDKGSEKADEVSEKKLSRFPVLGLGPSVHSALRSSHVGGTPRWRSNADTL